jgi:hypothetical protein
MHFVTVHSVNLHPNWQNAHSPATLLQYDHHRREYYAPHKAVANRDITKQRNAVFSCFDYQKGSDKEPSFGRASSAPQRVTLHLRGGELASPKHGSPADAKPDRS